jgi:hypothetical protein
MVKHIDAAGIASDLEPLLTIASTGTPSKAKM